MVLVMSLTITNLQNNYSDKVGVSENLAAQSAMVMMEKRMVTTSIAFHASLKNSPHPFF